MNLLSILSLLLALSIPFGFAQRGGQQQQQRARRPQRPKRPMAGGARNLGGARGGMGGARGGMGGGGMAGMGAMGYGAFDARCNTGWVGARMGFAGDNVCLLFAHEKATFAEAVTLCEHIDGARLVEIPDAMSNINLQNVMKMQVAKGLKFWIGMTDIEYAGHFIWLHDRQGWYQNFKLGAGTKDIGKNCVIIDDTGVWTDDSCSARNYFICMKK